MSYPEPDQTGRNTGQRWLWLLSVAILVFSFGNAYLGYDAQRSLAEDYAELDAVIADRRLLQDVRLLIVDAETGQRGYILTQQASYREPYDVAVGQLTSAMGALRERLVNYDNIARLMPSLEATIEAKRREIASTLRYAEENEFDVGAFLVSENSGQRYMENIRDASDAIEAALDSEIERLRLASERRRTRTLLALGSAATATVILLWALVAMGRRDAIRRDQINELLRTRNQELDDAVQLRTEELVFANQQFDRSNRELENFAYVVSHDLQEPLRKIRAFGDRLMRTESDALSDKARDYIDRMHSAATRMSTLLNDLLAFSRVNTRGLELVEINLNTLIETVVDDLEISIDERNADIEVEPDLPVVRGDETQLRQLFQNLIANALKFQPEKQAPDIRISHANRDDPDADAVRIDVEDNGIGFDERYLDRIFDPFQRLHGRHEYEGSGIGLAICRRIAERHGGSLTATSIPGQGSVFSVVLSTDEDDMTQSKIREEP